MTRNINDKNPIFLNLQSTQITVEVICSIFKNTRMGLFIVDKIPLVYQQQKVICTCKIIIVIFVLISGTLKSKKS